jgi:hypothetical protein
MNDPKRQFSDNLTRERFDMLATFQEEAQAREALGELRRAGFMPQEARLLLPEESSSGPFSLDGPAQFSPRDLIADRAIAVWIIICTEFVVGALGGAVSGWVVALFLNAPNIRPVWPWMLILGAVGAVLGILLGSWEWRTWARERERLKKQTAIGLRFSGRHPADQMRVARQILEQHGGSGIDNA